MIKILYLSFYYEPDLSAGSFRNRALSKALNNLLSDGSLIHVITTFPNRYSSFTMETKEHETDGNIKIKRIKLPTHDSGMLDQSKAFMSYAKEVLKQADSDEYDLVFASSSRLMTAALGAYISRKHNIPLYLDVRDIFVDTIKDVLPKVMAWFFKPFFGAVERWTINRANKLNVVSKGFLPYFSGRYPHVPVSIFTNGIDEEFLATPVETNDDKKEAPIEVLYAGNMGEGQGLHNIIPSLAKAMVGKVQFKLIGGGGKLASLKLELEKNQCNNVALLPPVSRKELIAQYQQADVLFLHLNDYEAFRKVLPSKLFEYAASGKPIWAGVSGYPAEFIVGNISNAEVFNPCDVQGGGAAFDRLSLGTKPRLDFVARFSRENIMKDMAIDVASVISEKLH